MAKKLDDRHLRDRLLDLIRAGSGRYEAALAVGLHTETYRMYYRDNPDFRDEVEAAVDASSEPVLQMLRREAMAGDITAAKEWLKHTAPPPRSEVQKIDIEVTHQTDPETLKSIADIRARLEGRTQSPAALPPGEDDDIIDGDIIDEGEPND